MSETIHVLDLPATEVLRMYKDQVIDNASGGRGMDVPKYFNDLSILDAKGVLEQDPDLHHAIIQSGQNPLLWQGVYMEAEESVKYLQTPYPSTFARQAALQRLQTCFRITEITRMDIPPNYQNPDVQAKVYPVWQATWNSLDSWRSFLQQEAIPPSPPPAALEPPAGPSGAPEPPTAPPAAAPETPPALEAVPPPSEPVVSPERTALEEKIQKIIYGPDPESLGPEQLTQFRRAKEDCKRAFKSYQRLKDLQGDEHKKDRLAEATNAIYSAKSALAASKDQFDEIAAAAQQILDDLKPFRLEKFYADYEEALHVNKLVMNPQIGFVWIESVLDEVSDLTDSSIESSRQDLYNARDKHYGQVLSCDQLINSAQEAMNTTSLDQKTMDGWWQEAEIMLNYARRRNPSPQELQAIADLEALFSNKEQAQQAAREAKKREYTIEVGQKYQIRGEEYTVTRKLGGGMFGEVYLASSPQGEEVVVKVAQKKLDREKAYKFGLEPERLVMLEDYQKKFGLTVNGEILTPIFLGSGETPSGRRFFAMTEAKGKPLDELCRYNLISPLEGVRIIRQACLVFEALHEGVGRCNKDFQFVNIFWDKGTGLITVVDWNMLDEKTPSNIQRDIAFLGMVLFRTVTGRDRDKNRPIREQTTGITQLKLKEIIENAIEPTAGQEYLSAKQLGEALASVQPPAADLTPPEEADFT